MRLTILFTLVLALGACGSTKTRKKEPLPPRIKQQEKGLAVKRDADTFTEDKPIPKATKAEIAEFRRIWAHFDRGDPRWPLERDRFKGRSDAAGYLLARGLLWYYMKLNGVRDHAGRPLVRAKNEIVAVGRPCAPYLVDMMILDTIRLRDKEFLTDDITRQDCMDMLERMGQHSTPHLLRALQRKDLGAKGRRYIALTLGGTRDPRALQPLISMLSSDESWQVRASAAIALGKLGNRRAIVALTRSVQKDPDRFVVKKAGEARYKLQAGRRG